MISNGLAASEISARVTSAEFKCSVVTHWMHPRKTCIMKYINVSLDYSPTTFFDRKQLCNPIVSTLTL